MRGKHLESPKGGENALPKPRSNAGIDVRQSHRRVTMKSSGDVVSGRPQYSSATPDMKGRLFSYKPNTDGV